MERAYTKVNMKYHNINQTVEFGTQSTIIRKQSEPNNIHIMERKQLGILQNKKIVAARHEIISNRADRLGPCVP